MRYTIKVNKDTIMPVYKVLHAFLDLGKYDLAWMTGFQGRNKDKGKDRVIGWIYINEENQMSGWDYASLPMLSSRHNDDCIIDTTTTAFQRSIVIDGKTIILSEDSYQALKASLNS